MPEPVKPFSSRTMAKEDWGKVKYLKAREFANPDQMGFEFIMWLDRVRELAGVPIVVTSSYRTPEHNREVGGAQDSAHTDVPCNAVDIGERPRPSDPNWNYSRFRIISAAIQLGCRRLGMYANGSLHLDMTEDARPAERFWRVVGDIKR